MKSFAAVCFLRTLGFAAEAFTLLSSTSASSIAGSLSRGASSSSKQSRVTAAATSGSSGSKNSFGVVSASITRRDRSLTCLEATGVFYSTSTGSTGDVAQLICAQLGESADEVEALDVDEIKGSMDDVFGKYDSLIVVTPTWNTGAETERSGTAWDEVYYGEMDGLSYVLNGKNVAIFGLGDQSGYGENFADATGELYDVFESKGAKLNFGFTSQEGYEHEASKSIRGDDKFCGLICDNANQEDFSEERVNSWISQLNEEGFFSGASAGAAAVAPAIVDTVVVEKKAAPVAKAAAPAVAAAPTGPEFFPYYNSERGSTFWLSKTNGRDSYITQGEPAIA